MSWSSAPDALCKDYQLDPDFLQNRLYGGVGSVSFATPSRRLAACGETVRMTRLEDHIERIPGRAGD